MWLLWQHPPALWLRPFVAVLIGASFAGLTFVAHETLHGAVVRHRGVRRAIGWVGFLPFAVSPRLWEAWHNGVHHGHANLPGKDPDTYPTLAEYESSAKVRAGTELALGRGRFRGAFSLLIGFSIQSLHVLVDAPRRKLLSRREYVVAVVESLLAASIWVVVALAMGPVAFLWAYVLPLLVANTVIMSFILTNHSLSPHTTVNDPLINSLSVTGPRWFEWLTQDFGFHVEHHLFPAMSARHGRRVRDVLRARWPERYQSATLTKALLALHRSARVYETSTTLVDPKSGRRWQTLTPLGDHAPSLPIAPAQTTPARSSRRPAPDAVIALRPRSSES
jgi:fatty acid desaturase